MKIGIRISCLLALVAACKGGGGGDVAADERARAEIDSLGREWEEAANTAQVERLIEIYAPDAVILPPGGPVIEGSETIRELFRQEFERFDTKLAFTTQEIEVAGDMAFRRGRYVWRGTPRLSGQTSRGRFGLTQRGRQAGQLLPGRTGELAHRIHAELLWQGPQCLHDRGVGQPVAAHGDAAARQHPDPIGGAADGQLGDQAGLADAGLAPH